jgi:hypothetical protein
MATTSTTLKTKVQGAANHAIDAGRPVPVRGTNLLAVPDLAVLQAFANGLDIGAVAAGILHRSDGRSVWIL